MPTKGTETSLVSRTADGLNQCFPMNPTRICDYALFMHMYRVSFFTFLSSEILKHIYTWMINYTDVWDRVVYAKYFDTSHQSSAYYIDCKYIREKSILTEITFRISLSAILNIHAQYRSSQFSSNLCIVLAYGISFA